MARWWVGGMVNYFSPDGWLVEDPKINSVDILAKVGRFHKLPKISGQGTRD